VTLAGVESVRCPIRTRRTAWERLANELSLEILDEMTVEAALEDVPALAEEILAGKTRGRVVIAVGP
jgi:acrylyl-CoA reductase (NADPH)